MNTVCLPKLPLIKVYNFTAVVRPARLFLHQQTLALVFIYCNRMDNMPFTNKSYCTTYINLCDLFCVERYNYSLMLIGHGHSHGGESHGHSHGGESHGHSHGGESHGHSHAPPGASQSQIMQGKLLQDEQFLILLEV